jgi:ubiquitin-protein ligase
MSDLEAGLMTLMQPVKSPVATASNGGIEVVVGIGNAGQLELRPLGDQSAPRSATFPFKDTVLQNGAWTSYLEQVCKMLDDDLSHTETIKEAILGWSQAAGITLEDCSTILCRITQLSKCGHLARAILSDPILNGFVWSIIDAGCPVELPTRLTLNGIHCRLDGLVAAAINRISLDLQQTCLDGGLVRLSSSVLGRQHRGTALSLHPPDWTRVRTRLTEDGLTLFGTSSIAMAMSSTISGDSTRRFYIEAQLHAKGSINMVLGVSLAALDMQHLASAHSSAILLDLGASSLRAGDTVLHLSGHPHHFSDLDVIGFGVHDDILYFTHNGSLLAGLHSCRFDHGFRLLFASQSCIHLSLTLPCENEFAFDDDERINVSVRSFVEQQLPCAQAPSDLFATADVSTAGDQDIQLEMQRSLVRFLRALVDQNSEVNTSSERAQCACQALISLLNLNHMTTILKHVGLYNDVLALLRSLVPQTGNRLPSSGLASFNTTLNSYIALSPADALLPGIISLKEALDSLLDDSPVAASEQIPLDPYANALDSLKVQVLDSDFSHHHFWGQAQQASLGRQALRRIASELTDLSTMACLESNAIFVTVCESRMNVMKVLITGAESTPFSSGCFLFDMFLPSDYPQAPPKMYFCTTGRGAVRLTPNLYNNGKVCLSLLGTWEGQSSESWTQDSSLLQVLTSIQALVLVPGVYFTEPGFEDKQGTARGHRLNEGYANISRYATLKYGMIDMLKTPPREFASIIR